MIITPGPWLLPTLTRLITMSTGSELKLTNPNMSTLDAALHVTLAIHLWMGVQKGKEDTGLPVTSHAVDQ